MRYLPFAIAMWGGLTLAVGGCQQRPVYNPRLLQQETFTAHSPYQVLPSPAMHQATAQPQTDQPLAWWQVRNEPWLNVRRGDPDGEWVYHRIITEDRQQSYGEHIHNVHRRRSRTVREGVFLR